MGRKRAEEFWDRVMREIFAILPETGAMNATQIIRLLNPATVCGAGDFREPITPRTLHRKTAGRAR